MILSFLFFTFLFYLLFKLVADFVIPIYKTTRQVKRKFSEMQQHMNQASGTANPQGKPFSGTNKAAEKRYDDYIDFEEVKDWWRDFPIFALLKIIV